MREVALTLARLMAYKDEYEVARLYTDPKFMQRMREQFSGDFKMKFQSGAAAAAGSRCVRPPEKTRVRRLDAARCSKCWLRLKGLRGTRVRSCSATPPSAAWNVA